jgi:catalase
MDTGTHREPGLPTMLVFDPSRVVDGFETSDDPILDLRPCAYAESSSNSTHVGHL